MKTFSLVSKVLIASFIFVNTSAKAIDTSSAVEARNAAAERLREAKNKASSAKSDRKIQKRAERQTRKDKFQASIIEMRTRRIERKNKARETDRLKDEIRDSKFAMKRALGKGDQKAYAEALERMNTADTELEKLYPGRKERNGRLLKAQNMADRDAKPSTLENAGGAAYTKEMPVDSPTESSEASAASGAY